MAEQTDYLLNEIELNKLSKEKRITYIYDWLRNLSKLLLKTEKDDIKDIQKTLVDQLMKQLYVSNENPTRKLIAKCLAMIFTVGDTFLLFDTINRCVETLKNKDDSAAALSTKLSSIICIGIMYENLGRLMGRTHEETVQLLLKLLKNSDSQTRFEIYSTLQMIIVGLGSAAASIQKDIYKSLKHGMLDRSMSVRGNAAKCLQSLIEYAPFLYTTEIENVFSLCFRSFDGSNYEVRHAIAQTLGTLLAITQNPTIRQSLQQSQSSTSSSNKTKIYSLEEVLNILSSGFLRGGIGFLKAGEMIKGSSTANREIRIGVIHTYIYFANQMGYEWIEKNIAILLNHLFEMLTNPKAVSTHLDAIHSRRCITFIIKSLIGTYITEKGQFLAIKELVRIISQYAQIGHLNSKAANAKFTDTDKTASTTDIQLAQHVLVVSLLELGTLINQLGASCLSILNDSQLCLVENICLVINHPAHVVRLSSAWCIRCICLAVNSQLTPLIERSLERLETLRGSPESINGHSYVLSALLGTVRFTALGIPHNKAKLIFNIAEDLLRTASQNSRLSMPRTQAGWQLMGAMLSLGPGQVKNLVPRLLLLWKNSFPRNTKELDSEKARGDAFTWQITLENRSGALATMASFLTFCSKLVTDDIRRRLLSPIESAITMLVTLNNHFKTLGPTIKGSYTMVRLRLYQVLLCLSPQLYENCFANLLRLLVSDLTLAENVVNTSSSLIRGLITTNADIVLGLWIQDTEHSLIEDQLQNHLLSGVGTIEHDPAILYRSVNDSVDPSSLPMAVAVIDKSALVFALVFPYVAQKHRIQMLNHFQECLKQSKSSRKEAIQINILTALLGALRTLAENKINLGIDEVRKLVVSQLLSVLDHQNLLIRYAAAESLGRCVQTINDGKFLSNITQQCFEKLRTARDALTRTGYSLAIGCIHHYVVGMGSVPQLTNNISLLLALADDHTSPSVQLWAMLALTLIVESGGPMFRPYVEATLAQCLKILMSLSPSLIDIHQSIAKCLSAIITTIGPEFQTSTHSIKEIRSLILIACSILQEHDDFLIKSETIGCFQQLHLFDRNCLELNELMAILCDTFLSQRYLLRKASISCFQQIAQKDSKALLQYGSEWVLKNKSNYRVGVVSNFNLRSNYQFPGILVALLDYETNQCNKSNIMKILNCLVQHVNETNLNTWIFLCKEVLSASDVCVTDPTENDHEMDDGDFEESGFKSQNDSYNVKISYRWQTRVYIMTILHKIISNCSQSKNSNIHFDLNLAREKHSNGSKEEDYLVLHLSDLVRMSFIGATSDCDQLQLEGLKTLELVIEKFARVPEPEFEDHVILEQYQAQVGAALRPAFAVDTPSHVTAMACQVCSAWIGSGVARDLNDLRRVHQLLVSSLGKLHKQSASKIYNESASTMEKLAILKAWAEVYVVAMLQNSKQSQTGRESLLDLVQPQLLTLSKYWIFALKDHALLTLPDEYIGQIPPDGSTFFSLETIDIVRSMYRASWPAILNAAALWLCSGKGFAVLEDDVSLNLTRYEQFYLLFGICIESLSNPKSIEQVSHVSTYLDSLKELIIHNEVTESILPNDTKLMLELCQVLHRLLLTHEVSGCQIVITEIIKSLIDIQIKNKKSHTQEDSNTESVSTKESANISDNIEPHKSIIYSLLEICLAILVRQLPQLCPTLAQTPEFSFVRSQKTANYLLFNNENARIISNVLIILTDLCAICPTAEHAVTILPTILYLFVGVFAELSVVCQTVYDEKLYEKEPIVTFLKCIKTLCKLPVTENTDIHFKWIQFLKSAMARILDLSKTSDEEQKQDFISTLLAIGVFIIHAPAQVLFTDQLRYPVINLMTRALQSENDLVQLKCIETLKLVFVQNELDVNFFIQNLTPELIDVFYLFVNAFRTNQCLSTDKVQSMFGILDCFEILVGKTVENKRINMLYIYIPALISLLNVDSPHTEMMAAEKRFLSQTHTKKLLIHEHSLKKLTEIGPKYPDEFKQIMNSNPTYSSSLKKAIHQQSKKSSSNTTGDSFSTTGQSNSLFQSSTNNETNNPTIKLKVDFSNYK